MRDRSTAYGRLNIIVIAFLSFGRIHTIFLSKAFVESGADGEKVGFMLFTNNTILPPSIFSRYPRFSMPWSSTMLFGKKVKPITLLVEGYLPAVSIWSRSIWGRRVVDVFCLTGIVRGTKPFRAKFSSYRLRTCDP